MNIKISFQKPGDLVTICQFAGVSPCQVLTQNGVRTETELVGRKIFVPISTPAMLRRINWHYVNDQSKISAHQTQT